MGDVRELVGIVAVRALKEQHVNYFFSARVDVQNLASEVGNRTCLLLQNRHGHPERIVAISLLGLLNKEGFLLVQLGKRDNDDKLVPAFGFPGCKQRDGEQPLDTLQRYLD